MGFRHRFHFWKKEKPTPRRRRSDKNVLYSPGRIFAFWSRFATVTVIKLSGTRGAGSKWKSQAVFDSREKTMKGKFNLPASSIFLIAIWKDLPVSTSALFIGLSGNFP
jgi:hypothetical protein